MTLQRVYPRSADAHQVMTNNVLARYSQRFDWPRSFPIPVEHIIEALYGLRIDWEVLPEGPGEVILGALHAKSRSIRMNEIHARPGGVLSQIGPTNFTLAHELGHWLYDIDQAQLDAPTLFGEANAAVLCRGERGLRDSAAVREINANKFAAHLMMPRRMVERALEDPEIASLDDHALAQRWQVSVSALRIRVEEIDRPDPPGAQRLRI